MGTNIIDKYSYLHFAVGIIFYYWNIDLFYSIILHTIFEIVENSSFGIHIINNFITFWPGGKPSPDTFINCVGDTLFFILGWLSAFQIEIATKN
jgi:hypothetical protein